MTALKRDPLTKPCGCGNPDCILVQRDGEKPYSFNRRLYATRACWPSASDYRGALVAPVDWLKQPPGRIVAQRQGQGRTP